jgi:Tol biopolymer transport system component
MGKILFTNNRDGTDEVYVMNADGSNLTNLTNHPAYDSGGTFSWDGTKIAFSSPRDGNVEIYVMDSNGSNQTRLTTGTLNSFFPVWSPNGDKIAFIKGSSTPVAIMTPLPFPDEAFLMDANGSNQTQLTYFSSTPTPTSCTPPCQARIGGITWAPDNSKIALSYFGIQTMDPDVSGWAGIAKLPPSNNNRCPAWSPDGTKVAFVGAGTEIFTMDSNGGNIVQLTAPTSAGFQPSWSPDGTKLAFTKIVSLAAQVFVMDANGSNQVQLTFPPGRSYITNMAWR